MIEQNFITLLKCTDLGYSIAYLLLDSSNTKSHLKDEDDMLTITVWFSFQDPVYIVCTPVSLVSSIVYKSYRFARHHFQLRPAFVWEAVEIISPLHFGEGGGSKVGVHRFYEDF